MIRLRWHRDEAHRAMVPTLRPRLAAKLRTDNRLTTRVGNGFSISNLDCLTWRKRIPIRHKQGLLHRSRTTGAATYAVQSSQLLNLLVAAFYILYNQVVSLSPAIDQPVIELPLSGLRVFQKSSILCGSLIARTRNVGGACGIGSV